MINLASSRTIIRARFLFLSCLLLASCVQSPVLKTEDHALIKSVYPIVAINGNEIEKTYQLDLGAGVNSLTVVYNTYQYDYFCTFRWLAKAGIAYEVSDHENRYPLTLYRWQRKNALWAIRLDPVDPLECTQKLR